MSSLGQLKLSDITVSHLQQYRRKRLSTKTNRGTYTDVATVNRELSTCRAMLNDVAAFRRLKIGETADNTLVFGVVDSVKKSFDAARTEAGLAHIRFHDLRHTAGTFLAHGGMNIALVAEILGHSDPKTTRRYINATVDTVEAARDILNKRQVAVSV